jgi:tryptophan 2,3-dioxygenase
MRVFRKTIDRDTPFEHALEHLYWQAAGKDYKTGKKSILLTNFENRYKEEFITFMKVYNTKNLWSRYKELSEEDQKNKDLVAAMRHYDYTVNITWVIAHFNAAKHYILATSGDGEATGEVIGKNICTQSIKKEYFFQNFGLRKKLKIGDKI